MEIIIFFIVLKIAVLLTINKKTVFPERYKKQGK